jgi:hypothetical protein
MWSSTQYTQQPPPPPPPPPQHPGASGPPPAYQVTPRQGSWDSQADYSEQGGSALTAAVDIVASAASGLFFAATKPKQQQTPATSYPYQTPLQVPTPAFSSPFQSPLISHHPFKSRHLCCPLQPEELLELNHQQLFINLPLKREYPR